MTLGEVAQVVKLAHQKESLPETAAAADDVVSMLELSRSETGTLTTRR
jgi:hypothetical protein